MMDTGSVRPQSALVPRVVVVGGGFGGVRVVRALRKSRAEVILVDKRNYHLFQPLLYQVATASLNPSQIAVPLRYGVEVQANCAVFLAEITGIDVSRSVVQIGASKAEYKYDFLVVASGCETNYFGQSNWALTAKGLKSIEDALEFRQKFLLAFEQAEMLADTTNVSDFLTFVVVGGGPTGVELAGAMAEITKYTLKKSFRRIDPTKARIILIDSGDRLLKSFPEKASARTKSDLEKLGVTILLGARVTEVNDKHIIVRMQDATTQEIKTTHVTWAAGVKASSLGTFLGDKRDASGRVEVLPDLTVAGHPNVYVIGDLAKYCDPKTGVQTPGVAQGAIQMGTFVGRNIAKLIAHPDRIASKSVFRYFDKGSMATIGRGKAVVAIAGVAFGGFFAWLCWAVVHAFFLIGLRNQLSTLATWIFTYKSYAKNVRLITATVKEDPALQLPEDPRLHESSAKA